MMDMIRDFLPEIWLLHMGFFLLYYAISDGMDLGVGIIALFSNDSTKAGTLMGSIRSSWHANQTWLVILAGMLFGAFPPFYAVVFSALYIPLFVMLFGLIFRGIALEYREHAKRPRVWDHMFAWGSLVTAVAQGFALGGILSGHLIVEDSRFAGGPWDWLNLYAVLVCLGVVIGYVMLGANFLILKTEGRLQADSYRTAAITTPAVLILAAGVHFWCAMRFPFVAERWTTAPWSYIIGGLTGVAGLCFILLLRALQQRREMAPGMLNIMIILFSFSAISMALYPHMVPSISGLGMTVDQAAAAPKAQTFMLYVSVAALPIILIYTTYEYWVYRGKTSKGFE
jgi:cytochrome d ubiquinol oxidase subunit II